MRLGNLQLAGQGKPGSSPSLQHFPGVFRERPHVRGKSLLLGKAQHWPLAAQHTDFDGAAASGKSIVDDSSLHSGVVGTP